MKPAHPRPGRSAGPTPRFAGRATHSFPTSLSVHPNIGSTAGALLLQPATTITADITVASPIRFH